MTARTVAKRSLIGGFAFMIIHAIVAAIWRRVILADTYESNGFFDFNEPGVLIVVGGLASYFLAGLSMSMLYGHFTAASASPLSPRIFVVLGALYWIVGDFGYIGRHEMENPALFLALEAVLVAVVFAAFLQVLPRVFSR